MSTIEKVIALLEKKREADIKLCREANALFNMLGRRLNGRDHEDGDTITGGNKEIDEVIDILRNEPRLTVDDAMNAMDDYFGDARFDIPWDILHKGEGKEILRERLVKAAERNGS